MNAASVIKKAKFQLDDPTSTSRESSSSNLPPIKNFGVRKASTKVQKRDFFKLAPHKEVELNQNDQSIKEFYSNMFSKGNQSTRNAFGKNKGSV